MQRDNLPLGSADLPGSFRLRSISTPLIAGLLVGLLSACATAPTVPPGTPATLEVENRTPDELRVSVRGRVEGVIEPGQRLRIRGLLPGDANVEASAQGAGAMRLVGTATLVAGETTVWTLMPDLEREPLPEVAALGSLTIENPEKVALMVTLSVDGRVVQRGRIFAGQTRHFEDLPSGVVVIEAQPEPVGATVRYEATVFPDGSETKTSWSYAAAGARLEVVNSTDEAIELSVDGQPRGRVPAGQTVELTEGPGLKVLTARSVPSLRPYETVVGLNVNEPTRWEVMAGQARLVVENQTGERIALTVRRGDSPAAAPVVDGHEIAAGDRFELPDIETGIQEIRAVGLTSNLVYAGRIELFAGQAGTFVAGSVHGSVRVDNRTHAAIMLYMTEGTLPERFVGQVEPGKIALIKDLERGPIKLRALHEPTSVGRFAGGGGELLGESDMLGAGILRLFSTQIDLSEIPAASWVVSERVGGLGIKNRRDEGLDIYADADRLGEVLAGSEKVFTGVPAGTRRVEVVGRKSGHVAAHSLVVLEDGLVSLEIQDITAFLVVENATNEVLIPRGVLSSQAERIEPGQAAKFRVRAGDVGASLVGASSGFAYSLRTAIPAGETMRWIAVVTPGRLIVWSQLAESVAVTLGDTAQGTLAPDETLALTDLLPGPYRVQTVGLTSGRIKAYDVVVQPGGDRKVTLSLELGVVLVENLAKEPVEVSIGGVLYGTVQASRVHAFGRVPPGPVEVTFDYPKSRRTQRVALDLREGQRARVVAHPPQGLVIIENGAREDLRVEVDKVTVARISKDAGPALVSVPSGSRHVQIERLASRTQVGFVLDIAADHAIHLPVPPTDVRLVVVNRTDKALELFADDGSLLTVGAKASEMVEGVGVGLVRLVARDPATGAITHEERRTLRAGETAAWVLD